MGPTLTNPSFTQVGDRTYRLESPLVFVTSFHRIVVPAGYTTDYASVPWGFRWLMPQQGRYSRAAVLHDWLCDQAAKGECSRFYADAIFREAMLSLNVPWCQRVAVFYAVRMFGALTGRG